MACPRLTAHEIGVLRNYADTFGRRWKSCLRLDWEQACEQVSSRLRPDTLQSLRNAAYFGPAGLVAFTFKGAWDSVTTETERRSPTKTVTMTCGDCGGSGHDHGPDVPCADEPETADSPASPCDEDCGQCDGSGEVSVLVD